mmetsp:Transcript_94783/g.210739  ORF Transcript_94783/g.210739 Transcript_94783/m.210739 type:complete len:421 (-) Transcript_94783:80-1342(-)
MASTAGRKIFVGSLPQNISDATLRATFQQYGQIEDVFIKPGCDVGRQWAFVTFAEQAQASKAKECCDRILTFPGADRPCDVMLARNQGEGGPGGGGARAPDPLVPTTLAVAAVPATGTQVLPDSAKKIFVGSLPDGIDAQTLQNEFSKYGHITDTYLKQGCEPGRQWAFVTYSSAQEAQLAKVSTDRILVMPGAARACEVTIARHQGMFGQEPVAGLAPAQQPVALQVPSVASGPRKIFVGSLPDNISEPAIRAEFEKYGQVVDIFLKTGCEPGRQWAFVTYGGPEQAQMAKEATDRVLTFPGADRACEVMLAKNQGKFGQDPVAGAAPAAQQLVAVNPYQDPVVAAQLAALYGQAIQPPPPNAPAPAHLTQWRCYHTAAGLPYYHNHATGVTQWECPPELAAATAATAAAAAQVRYSPY